MSGVFPGDTPYGIDRKLALELLDRPTDGLESPPMHAKGYTREG